MHATVCFTYVIPTILKIRYFERAVVNISSYLDDSEPHVLADVFNSVMKDFFSYAYHPQTTLNLTDSSIMMIKESHCIWHDLLGVLV